MSKIERYQGNLRAFASNAQGLERTVFGEMAQADDLTSQVTQSFLRGWGIVGASEHPSLEDFNAAMYAMSQFIAYQHQVGVPEWHAEQEYYIGSICTHSGESYQSLQDANIGNKPPSAEWTPILTSKNGLENLGLGAGAPAIGIPFFWPASAMPNTVMPEWSNMVFLKWNGATFSADTYPKLALVIPSLKLTDVRGEFPRFWDDGRGVDSGRALLSAQDAQVANHNHGLVIGYEPVGSTTINTLGSTPNQDKLAIKAMTNATQVTGNGGAYMANNTTTGAENRPRNIAFNFLVRAK